MHIRFVAILLFCLAVHPLQTARAENVTTIAGRQVHYWTPVEDAGRRPLVLFSHGLNGCATQSRFLMEALAAAGYWIFAPNHEDAKCGDAAKGGGVRPEEPLRDADQWTESTYAGRGEDLHLIFQALQSDPAFSGKIDFSALALAGHSLGGYTVLGLAGAWPSWKLSGVRAVLALSPHTRPFNEAGTLGGLVAPVMYQGGTRDLGITPAIRRPGGSYDLTPAPKYYVEFDGAGHFAWTSLFQGHHDLISAYSLAFLDTYIKGGKPPALLTRPAEGVSSLKSDMGAAAPGAEDVSAEAGRQRRFGSRLRNLLKSGN